LPFSQHVYPLRIGFNSQSFSCASRTEPSRDPPPLLPRPRCRRLPSAPTAAVRRRRRRRRKGGGATPARGTCGGGGRRAMYEYARSCGRAAGSGVRRTDPDDGGAARGERRVPDPPPAIIAHLGVGRPAGRHGRPCAPGVRHHGSRPACRGRSSVGGGDRSTWDAQRGAAAQAAVRVIRTGPRQRRGVGADGRGRRRAAAQTESHDL
jgi:hypothetical protein